MESKKTIFFPSSLICLSLFSASLSLRPLFIEGTGSGDGASLQCMLQLMLCRPYLKGSNPPATCCIPLKQAVADEPQCLCLVFENQVIMNSPNVTFDDTMALAQACGAHADLTVCQEVATSPKSPALTSPLPPAKGESPLAFGRGGGHGGGRGGRSSGGEDQEPEPLPSSGRAVPTTFPRGGAGGCSVQPCGQYSAAAELVPKLSRFILASTAATASIIVSLF